MAFMEQFGRGERDTWYTGMRSLGIVVVNESPWPIAIRSFIDERDELYSCMATLETIWRDIVKTYLEVCDAVVTLGSRVPVTLRDSCQGKVTKGVMPGNRQCLKLPPSLTKKLYLVSMSISRILSDPNAPRWEDYHTVSYVPNYSERGALQESYLSYMEHIMNGWRGEEDAGSGSEHCVDGEEDVVMVESDSSP